MKIIEDIKRSLDRNLMSTSVRKILEEEEENGAVIANKFRYIFFLFIIIGGIANIFTIDDSELQIKGFKIYAYGLFIYLFITVLHTFVLKKKNLKLNMTFGYITLIADYFVLTAMMLAWNHLQSPNNFNYFLKNPSMMYYFLMFISTLIQIRIRLVIAGAFIFLAIHFVSLIYGLMIGVKKADSWVSHVLERV